MQQQQQQQHIVETDSQSTLLSIIKKIIIEDSDSDSGTDNGGKNGSSCVSVRRDRADCFDDTPALIAKANFSEKQKPILQFNSNNFFI